MTSGTTKICRLLATALAGACTLASSLTAASPRAQGPAEPPRLIVILVVDQMRADYVTRYSYQWTRGLRRLFASGATFPLTRYPYAYTVTCAGHATIATGSFPATHGMVGNEWYDRDERKTVACTNGPEQAVAFGGRTGTGRHGPSRLKVPTFTDQLRQQAARPPTVVTMSLKARSAISLAGHPSPSTYAVWEEGGGTWTTSTAYTPVPWPVIDSYVRSHPIAEDYGEVWNRALPASRYLYTDFARGELAPAEFPHVLESVSGEPDARFATLWRRSPMSDRYLGRLAQDAVRALKLGQQGGTDVLGISFSALDVVGHEYGPRSHEVQDTMVRLDETIGLLLDTLDALVGPDHYVVGLTADHGVAPIPEQSTQVVDAPGRISGGALRAAINDALVPFLGTGSHVVSQTGPNVYLAPGAIARVMATDGAREAVTTALLARDGVAGVYWPDALASWEPTSDPLLRAARLSYVPDRSGDLMVIYSPLWMAQAAGTTHGSPYEYDQRVPLVLAGAGIKPGRYLDPATPADLVPTLARLVGITLGQVDGRVLTAALK